MTPRFYSLLVYVFILFVAMSDSSHAADLGLARQGVVQIASKNKSGDQIVGSGFIYQVIDSRIYILTSSHVIGSLSDPAVRFFPDLGKSYKSLVGATEGEETEFGLGYLIVDSQPLPAGIAKLAIASAAPLIAGATYYAIGFPAGGSPWSIVPQVYAGPAEGAGNNFTPVMARGMSGGPIINDQGLVVGVDYGANMSFEQSSSAAKLLAYVPFITQIFPESKELQLAKAIATRNASWVNDLINNGANPGIAVAYGSGSTPVDAFYRALAYPEIEAALAASPKKGWSDAFLEALYRRYGLLDPSGNSGELNAIESFLKAKADPNLRLDNGAYPCLLAQAGGRIDFALLLKKYGGKCI